LIPSSANTLTLGKNLTEFPLTIPDGFSISIFADTVPGARVLALDTFNNLWVSQRKQGMITQLIVQDGNVVSSNTVLRNLKNPHGLSFDPKNPLLLYYAEEDKISRIITYSEAPPEKIIDLPGGGRHTTRTLLFGEDNKLYVSIGSSCDVCEEKHPWLASVVSMNKDGSDAKVYSRGLRNAVFIANHPITGQIWATEMGRDMLGDNLPPDEINILTQDANYGWPTCYGKNIHDTVYDKNTYIRTPCLAPFETPSYIDIPAHSAPLGLAFFPQQGWPEKYSNDLLVAYHGSWNRTEPTGYKIVRYKLDEQGNYLGVEDFISGWLTNDGALGRPVDILITDSGILYITDDKAGVIYKVEYNN